MILPNRLHLMFRVTVVLAMILASISAAFIRVNAEEDGVTAATPIIIESEQSENDGEAAGTSLDTLEAPDGGSPEAGDTQPLAPSGSTDNRSDEIIASGTPDAGGTDSSSLDDIPRSATPEVVDDEKDVVSDNENASSSLSGVSWSQPEPIVCEVTKGSDAVAIYEEIVYRCDTTIEFDGDLGLIDGRLIVYTVSLRFSDSISISLPDGSEAWMDENDVTEEGTYLIYQVARGASVALSFDIAIARTSCIIGTQYASISVDTEVIGDAGTFVTEEPTNTSTDLAVEFTPADVPPAISLSSIAFEPLVWDGEQSWGSAQSSSVLTVTNDGCPVSAGYVVQAQVLSDDPGISMSVTNVEAGAEVSSAFNADARDGSPISLIYVPMGFVGESSSVVGFQLTADADAAAGQYSLTLAITVNVAP